MNKLLTNPDVIEAYLAQNTSSGTNPKQTLWFKGTKLYSYDSLLAIIEPLDKVLFIDNHFRNYSMTTQKQTQVLVNMSTDYTKFSLPLGVSQAEVLKYYWASIELRITSFNRALKQTSKDSHKHWITNLVNEAQSYMDYVGVDKRTKEYKYKHQITKQLFKHQIL